MDSFSAMHVGMARIAKCDQVFFGVMARMTPKLFVVNFQVRHCATGLTAPTVAT
jgi:hypothetical protein